MTEPALSFTEADHLGRVASVDTSKVLIDADDPNLVTQVGIGNLVAIKGATEREFLIGITERVTRSLREDLMEEVPEEAEVVDLGPCPADLVRVVLIGTYRTVVGEEKDVFKRGADSFPQIDRECFLIQGTNLQGLMGLLAAGVAEDERLKLGHFVIDPNAEAIASGDKFFQRHASILGSTGSGKSWAVALLLEKASQLKFPNLTVLDMHGEYQPLTEGDDGYAKRFRIAGPGDLDAPSDEAIFLPYWLLNRDEMLSMILDRSDQNAPNQASRFTSHVRSLKEATLEANGKAKVKETFTVDSPVPYQISDLMGLLETDDTTKGVGKTGPVKGEWEGRLTRFISRLRAKLEDRRYGFLFQPPTDALAYDWLAKQMLRLLSAGEGSPGSRLLIFRRCLQMSCLLLRERSLDCYMTFSSGLIWKSVVHLPSCATRPTFICL